MIIAAGKFKAQCLGIMDDVRQNHQTVTITKRGKAIAKLVPVDGQPTEPVFGFLKGHVRIAGDIVAPTGEVWNADA